MLRSSTVIAGSRLVAPPMIMMCDAHPLKKVKPPLFGSWMKALPNADTMIVLQGCKYAISAAIALSLALLSPAEAGGRARVQDHRHVNIGGQAIPGGYHFGSSFEPHGRRATVQDHRSGTTVSVPESQPHGGHPEYRPQRPPVVNTIPQHPPIEIGRASCRERV